MSTNDDRYHKLGLVDPGEIKDLYWGYGLSLSEIAARYTCSARSIQVFMVKRGIPRRAVGRQEAHGQSATTTYRSWKSAKARCFNPNNKQYAGYGGRGLMVCKRWRLSFEAFLEDMGERPEGRTLDRIDNDAHYSCGHCNECLQHGWQANCRWSTPQEQAFNRRPKSRANLYFRKYGCLECGSKEPPCTPDACSLG